MSTKSKTTTTRAKKPPAARTFLLGFDLGTNTSCLSWVETAGKDVPQTATIPTVVGYAREGLLDGILPENARQVFGEAAYKHQMHLDLVAPLKLGVIDEAAAARDFCRHAAAKMGVSEQDTVRAVIGVPASTDAAARERVRKAVQGVFHEVILIPEPFLAALGYRDEQNLGEADYLDPVHNSLFIDIGAGSTDLCLVQGYYPRPDDQVSIPYAGDAIDEAIADGIRQQYPDSDLTPRQIRKLKEDHAYVGTAQTIPFKCLIAGKPRTLEIGTTVHIASDTLLAKVFEGVCALIAKANPDSVPELLQNIVVTGGGCLIRDFASELQNRLVEEGFAAPQVRALGEQYKTFVARGALKAALAARDDQWQKLL